MPIYLNHWQVELVLDQTNADDRTYVKTSVGKLYWLANTNRSRLDKTRKDFLP